MKEESEHEEKILCPKCEWEPDGYPYWMCHCGYVWNTFDTYGKCPKCGYIHRNTQCIECGKTSPHPDWYVDIVNFEIEELITQEQKIDI
jgi:hypothetical protein